MVEKSVRDKVEEWVKLAPKEINIIEFDIIKIQDNIKQVGTIIPILADKGYRAKLEFSCNKWED